MHSAELFNQNPFPPLYLPQLPPYSLPCITPGSHRNKLCSYAELFSSLLSLLDPDASWPSSDAGNNDGAAAGGGNGYSLGSGATLGGAVTDGFRSSSSSSNHSSNSSESSESVSSPIELSDFLEQLLER